MAAVKAATALSCCPRSSASLPRWKGESASRACAEAASASATRPANRRTEIDWVMEVSWGPARACPAGAGGGRTGRGGAGAGGALPPAGAATGPVEVALLRPGDEDGPRRERGDDPVRAGARRVVVDRLFRPPQGAPAVVAIPLDLLVDR